MKVLGGTLDVDYIAETGYLTPKLVDREGNEMDPNAWEIWLCWDEEYHIAHY